MKHDIVLTVPIYATAVEQLDQNFTVHRLWQAKHRSTFFAEIRDRVRSIATQSVGVDHIDLAAARERGIAVTNTPDVLTEDVADIAMSLVLAVARRLVSADRHLRSGAWLKGNLPFASK